MKILVVNVAMRPESKVKLFPVGLGYVCTAMKNAGYSFDLIDIDGYRYCDEELDALLQRDQYDVICFGCIVTGYKIAKNLAAKLRRLHPNSCIVVGNTVASSIPEILLSKTEVDVAVMGEGDITIVELLKTLETEGDLASVEGICFSDDKGVHANTPRAVIRNLDDLPTIDYDIFDVDIYIENMRLQLPESFPIPREQVRGLAINTARGCIGKCTFCYHAFQHAPYRRRSIESILNEVAIITEKHRVNLVGLSDELSFYKKRQVRDFAQAILDSGLKFCWGCQCRAGLFDSEEDLEIIALMKEAGCIGASFSLESADEEILAAMNKHITVPVFSRQAQLFRKGGLPVHTSLVFGYPQETPETIRHTFDVCIENGIYPSSGYLLPQPGSGMYDYAKEQGFIDDEEAYLLSLGDRQDLLLNMTSMPDEELVAEVTAGAKRCNEALKLGLNDKELIKTGYYRGGKKTASGEN